MEISTGSLQESVLKSISASLISIPLTDFAMGNYAALTVSLNPDNIVGTMTTGAVITTAILVMISVFMSSYFKLQFNSSNKPLT